MTIAVNDLINKAEVILSDSSNDRFLAADLLGWLNTGLKAASAAKPDIYVKHENLSRLVAGVLQSITGCILLLDITHNMGTDGTTVGAIITRVKEADLDISDPSWRSATASATVEHFTYDKKDPTQFQVYPPQPSTNTGYVRGKWWAVPPDVAARGNLAIDDIYEPALLDYILFRAFSMDAAIHPNAAARSIAHAQLFLTALGSQEQVENFVSRETTQEQEPPIQQQEG